MYELLELAKLTDPEEPSGRTDVACGSWGLTKERAEGIFLMGRRYRGACICENSLNCILRFVLDNLATWPLSLLFTLQGKPWDRVMECNLEKTAVGEFEDVPALK